MSKGSVVFGDMIATGESLHATNMFDGYAVVCALDHRNGGACEVHSGLDDNAIEEFAEVGLYGVYKTDVGAGGCWLGSGITDHPHQ